MGIVLILIAVFMAGLAGKVVREAVREAFGQKRPEANVLIVLIIFVFLYTGIASLLIFLAFELWPLLGLVEAVEALNTAMIAASAMTVVSAFIPWEKLKNKRSRRRY